MSKAEAQTGKRLIVLVGTSVFTSATWRLADSDSSFAQSLRDSPFWHGYRQWERECLDAPAARNRSALLHDDKPVRGESVHSELVRSQDVADWIWRLCKDNEAQMQEHVAIDASSLRHPKRYSAEISTLLQLYRENTGVADLHNLFDDYVSVQLWHSGDPRSASAATILHQVLEMLTARPGDTRLQTCDCISGEPDALLDQSMSVHLGLLEQLGKGPTDVVVSGGYKIFAVMAGFSLGQRSERWQRLDRKAGQRGAAGKAANELLERLYTMRMLYLHEETGGLVIQDGDSVGYRGHSVDIVSEHHYDMGPA